MKVYRELPKVNSRCMRAIVLPAAALACLVFTGSVAAEKRAGSDWWSLQPIRRPPVPEVHPADLGKVRNSIDAFVLSRLRQEGLSPSSPAEARLLMRRVFFDLTGLPPSPEQVEAFVAKPDDDAYRDLVDELLASPHYGERWGRHWLDVARFGESDGFERNNVRENQWHFRDWVIESLNADMPYNEFARLQIDGDIRKPGREGLAAVAFLTAGVHNTTVGSSEFMKRTARQDELEEIAGAVGQTFVGLTINCARCHDHKFDPVTQREYYRFVSALSGVFHGEMTYSDPAADGKAALASGKVAELAKQLEAFDEPVREKVLEKRKNSGVTKPAPPKALYAWEFETGFDDSSGQISGKGIGSPRLEGGALVIDDGKSFVETPLLPEAFGAKTLEATVQLSNLQQRGGAVVSLQTQNGVIFDAIVFGERQERCWMAGSDHFKRSQKFGGAEEKEAVTRPVHIVIVWHEDGTIERYRDGQPYGETYKAALKSFASNQAVLRFGIRHFPPGGNKHLSGRIFNARLYDSALSPGAVAAAVGSESSFVSEEEILAALHGEARAARALLLENLNAARTELSKIDTAVRGKIYTVAARGNPGSTKVLKRGNAMEEGEEVTPGAVLAVQGVSPDFGLPANAPDSARRGRLADWITSKDNPLFARVIANRLWHHHFGSGLIETPNDFGLSGGLPSHPELLDWLATELAEQGWSLKKMHHLIVTSATYRQSSRPNAKGLAADAGNRLLWRKSPTRLDAESLRDSMLVVSGKLDPQRGGPGFRDVGVKHLDGTTYYSPFDEENGAFHRRTVYRFSPRGARSAILDTFDCPDPANAAPRRSVTTTPLQALALLNNAFSLRIGGHFAARVVREAGEKTEAQVERAYRLAFGRLPDEREQKAASTLVSGHGPGALARVLFNSNEFIVIE